uniref:Ubiquitin-like 7b (bone marrow stromal cell-derived) n=1 Tax=Astyanax mexicanus TaxID=7994 RepID=W5KDQ3_ASTMX
MDDPGWYLSLKLMDRPKAVFRFSDTGTTEPRHCSVSTLKQLLSTQLPDSLPHPELMELVHCGCKLKDHLTLDSYEIKSGSTLHILKKAWPEPDIKPEPVNRTAAAREFRLLQAAMHSNATYRDAVFKMLSNKESLEQIIVASPGLNSDPVALGESKSYTSHTYSLYKHLRYLIPAHPALVNAVILILHSVTSSLPSQSGSSSSRSAAPSSYSDMPGGFLFEGMSDDEEDFQSVSRAGSSRRSRGPAGSRPVSLGTSSGATGPRPITQSELATALALASTPENTTSTTPNTTVRAVSTPVSSSVFSQALQAALQASGVPGRWRAEMQQLRDMGIRDEDLALRALQATDGDLQAALELIFAGGGV